MAEKLIVDRMTALVMAMIWYFDVIDLPPNRFVQTLSFQNMKHLLDHVT